MNEPAIADVLHDVFDALQQHSVEVIVVDKSKDETAIRAAELGATVIHQTGTECGDACVTGFQRISEDAETVVIRIVGIVAVQNDDCLSVFGYALKSCDARISTLCSGLMDYRCSELCSTDSCLIF